MASLELKAPAAKTVQRTVRVPVDLDNKLAQEAAKVGDQGISVPRAIVQILEAWEAAESRKKKRR